MAKEYVVRRVEEKFDGNDEIYRNRDREMAIHVADLHVKNQRESVCIYEQNFGKTKGYSKEIYRAAPVV